MSTQTGPKIPVFTGAADGDTYTPPMNRGWRMLQALVQCNVLDVTLTAPPVAPVDGDTYIVAVGGTGAWAGHDAEIAYWTTQDSANPAGVWEFYTPAEGWFASSQGDQWVYKFQGGSWFTYTNAFQSSDTFDGAGNPGVFVISPAFQGITFTVMVSYTYPLVNPGILSVEYVDAVTFKVHSSSGTDASQYRVIAFPI